MSVRLGISTRKVEKAQKKGAPAARPSSNCVRKPLAREASLARLRRFGKGFRPSSTVQFGQFARFIRRVRGLSPSPSTLSLRSSFAGHALPRRSGVAAPRVARQGEAWRPGLELNQDVGRCTAPAWPFRHRADPIIADRPSGGHRLCWLTLTPRARAVPRTSCARDCGRYSGARASQ